MGIEHGSTSEDSRPAPELLTKLFKKVYGEQVAKRSPNVDRHAFNDVTDPNFQHVGAVLGAILFSGSGGRAMDVIVRGNDSESEVPAFDVKQDIAVSEVNDVRVEALLVHFEPGSIHEHDSGRLFMSSDYGVSSIDYPRQNIN